MFSWTVVGIITSVLMPFAVMSLAVIIRKLGASAETSRKFVHILVSNWIVIAVAVYDSAWTACIIPAFFVIFNYLSATKGIFPAMERSDENNTLGTFWYAVSLLILTLFAYLLDKPWASVAGMLAMGYGDGLAALIGEKFGRHHFSGVYSKKTLEGTVSAMLFSGISAGIVCFMYRDYTYSYYFIYVALACLVPAGIIELTTPKGLDNISLPLSVAFIAYILDVCPETFSFFLSLSIELLILIIAYYLRAITIEAFMVASILGCLIFVFSGWVGFNSLLLFFCIGSIVSVVGKNHKKESEFISEHIGPRVVAQVLANGLPALFFSIIYYYTKINIFLLTVIICFAADSADTFSSELGMLSNKKPLSILTFKPIQKGLSGGVTVLGFFGAFFGAFCISILAYGHFGLYGQVLVIIAGVFNSFVDSLLGAAFQAKYVVGNRGNQKFTEKPIVNGTALKLISGVKWINNDWVNFLSVFITGILFSAISKCLLG